MRKHPHPTQPSDQQGPLPGDPQTRVPPTTVKGSNTAGTIVTDRDAAVINHCGAGHLAHCLIGECCFGGAASSQSVVRGTPGPAP